MTTLKDYPYWAAETLEHVKDQLGQICHIRKDDITQVQNFTSIFVTGRKVGKIPSASNDVSPTDRLGDMNYTASYLYILIDNSGTPEWRRFTAGSW